ncbi:MAG TPA: Sir2 family NAD-dependent protein deacetylase [Chthonomonadaceae bacterium]|nr:Sir2 family NAD-dependent protein deacetylase [Chthonomonadaceae bacterium]
MRQEIERAAAALRGADALLITAGAGIGVDSGLPDFRGNSGFWKAYPPLERLGVSFEEMATPDWFKRDPHLAWGFYGHRLQLYRQTEPHAGFALLRDWATSRSRGWFIFSSNVDGQFQKAGFDPDRLVECHGSIHHLQCQLRRGIWSADDLTVEVDIETLRSATIPLCSCCQRTARPNILMFGDYGWDPTRTETQLSDYRDWLRHLSRNDRLVIVEIGAGTNIPTVRAEGENIAIAHNATLIRINPREATGDRHTIAIQMGARKALAAIQEVMDAGVC